MKTALDLAQQHAVLGCTHDTKRGHRIFGARLAAESGLVGLEAERFARDYAEALYATQRTRKNLTRRPRESWAA